MTNDKADKAELHRLARLGAQMRLREMDEERTAILAIFPDLPLDTPTVQAQELEPPRHRKTRRDKGTKRSKHKRGSPAARKRQSVIMKERWAKHFKEGMQGPLTRESAVGDKN